MGQRFDGGKAPAAAALYPVDEMRCALEEGGLLSEGQAGRCSLCMCRARQLAQQRRFCRPEFDIAVMFLQVTEVSLFFRADGVGVDLGDMEAVAQQEAGERERAEGEREVDGNRRLADKVLSIA